MILKNGIVLNEKFEFINADITIKEQYISQITLSSDVGLDHIVINDIINCDGKYIVPGLIDIHIHGAKNKDFCDARIESVQEIAKYLGENGITSFLATTLTLPELNLNQIVDCVKEFINMPFNYSYCHGIYLEGPFCSKSKKGAQNENYLQNPNLNMFNRISEKSGNNIKVVTIAPELDNSMEFIEKLNKDVVISIAHTDAMYDTVTLAIKKGAHHATHLYNAMSGLSHRDPGAVGAIFDSNITAELICDGVHIHESVIRTTYNILGEDRLVLMSDSMCATGIGEGDFDLGGQPVSINGNVATLKNGTLAGSVTNLMDCTRFAIKVGIPIEKAIKCASYNPAKVIGVEDIVGSISVGKFADILVLNTDLSLDQIYIKGRKIL